MQKCEIFFSANDELTESAVIEKGWKGHIIVKIADVLFNVNVVTPERLLADFNNSIELGYIPDIDEKLVLVKQTDRDTIIKVLVKLAQIGYFSKMKPVDLKQEYASYLQELQDLKNWIRVY